MSPLLPMLMPYMCQSAAIAGAYLSQTRKPAPPIEPMPIWSVEADSKVFVHKQGAMYRR